MFRRARPEDAAVLGSCNGKKPLPEAYKALKDLLRAHEGRRGMGMVPQRLLDYRLKRPDESLPPLSLPQAGADGSAQAGAGGSAPTARAARALEREELRLPPASPSRSRSRAKKPSSRKKKK